MGPFEDLRQALESAQDDLAGQIVRSDLRRQNRTGSPEVIYAANKSIAQMCAGISELIAVTGRVIVSRIPQDMVDALRTAIPHGSVLSMHDGTQSGVVHRSDSMRPSTGGRVGVISAGSSDIPVAAEAALVASEMGCDVQTTWDVGVAGIHRLVRPLESMIEWDADVVIVAAGMDGILPTIVSGLVAQPVIGLPVSTGYGFGGQGIGALTTMLQTCSPGLAVVNIDNGVGAGITAGRIANNAARARSV